MTTMSPATPDDAVRVTVLVPAPPQAAFHAFTSEIDQWWRRGPKYRVAGLRRGTIHIEPTVDGRLYEVFDVDGVSTVFDIGRIVIWDPPLRLAMTWRASNFALDESTEVDVTFTGQRGNTATLITVTHRGWHLIRPDHPIRHRLSSQEFLAMKGRWWADLLNELRSQVTVPPRRS